jgi:hypothetical protein
MSAAFFVRRSQTAATGSKNDDRVAHADEVFDARSVPVGQADAAVAGGAADRLRIVRAVDADAGLVQAHPKNTYEIIRPGR